MKINEITIRGEKQESSELVQSTDLIQLKDSYRVGGNTRGTSENHKVKLDDNNIIELVFEDTTTWFCSPNTIEEIFPEAAIKSRSGNESFEIPTILRGDNTERGVVNDVILKVINIFTRKKINTKVKELAADLEKKQLENQSGLYRIDRNFQLQKWM